MKGISLKMVKLLMITSLTRYDIAPLADGVSSGDEVTIDR